MTAQEGFPCMIRDDVDFIARHWYDYKKRGLLIGNLVQEFVFGRARSKEYRPGFLGIYSIEVFCTSRRIRSQHYTEHSYDSVRPHYQYPVPRKFRRAQRKYPRYRYTLDHNTGGTGIFGMASVPGYRILCSTIQTHYGAISWHLWLCWQRRKTP